ncbi:hypothetical protein BH23ACT11_BH23ACT11_13610 [soil metagenome]
MGRGRTSRQQDAPRRSSRLSVRPTARGWQALIFGALVMFVARMIGTTQFYQLAYALLGLVLAALVLGLLGSRGIDFSRRLPAGVRFTAGKLARVDLLLSNSSRFGTSEVRVIDRVPKPQSFDVPGLSGGGGDEVEVPVTFENRGIYELGPAEVRVLEPFRLLQFVRKFPGGTEAVVYPEVHELSGFSQGRGNTEAGAVGALGQRGEEFAGLREYRRGDDRRHIHWKSMARTGELFVKEFALQAPRRYTVALDLRRQGLRVSEKEVEDAVSAAASVLAHLRDEGLPFRLICTNRQQLTTEFGSDNQSYWAAMRLLATVKADGRAGLRPQVLDERERLGEGVVMISRTADDTLPQAIRNLRGAGLSVFVLALATHTYRPGGNRESGRTQEAAFLADLARLESSGAVVRAVRRPDGVAGLAGREKAIG